MKYFEAARTLEDVKQLYKKLARDLHPDCNPERDTTAEFQEMQRQYSEAFKRLKNVHINKDGETYERDTEETPEQFADLINALLKMPGLMIELCGSWLWITGDTRSHKDELKNLGFKWSKNKAAWYFHFEPYRKHSKKSVDLDTIRAMYGSQKFTERTATQYREIEATA
jgi:curved DNA-binding protein CbpA